MSNSTDKNLKDHLSDLEQGTVAIPVPFSDQESLKAYLLGCNTVKELILKQLLSVTEGIMVEIQADPTRDTDHSRSVVQALTMVLELIASLHVSDVKLVKSSEIN